MTQPISQNRSLVPRKNGEAAGGNGQAGSRATEETFHGYAPPGAQWQARVRRLSEEGPGAAGPVTDREPEARPAGRVTVDRNGEQQLVLRIDAEVTINGTLPPEGVAVETVTVIRHPGGANGEGEKR